MEPEAIGQFDDPHLKAAIKRLRGGHRAAPALREQLVRRLAELQDEREADPMRLVPARPSRVQWRLAVAAVLLLAIGGVAVPAYRHHLEAERQEYIAANQQLLLDMVAAHENGKGADVVAQAGGDPAAVARKMQAMLGRSIPTVDLGGSGWTLQAADVSQVGAHRAGHWRLTRGGQTISVFSLPVAAMAYADEVDHYESILQQHPLAGYVKDGGLHCVVGDPSVSLDEAVQLANHLQRS